MSCGNWRAANKHNVSEPPITRLRFIRCTNGLNHCLKFRPHLFRKTSSEAFVQWHSANQFLNVTQILCTRWIFQPANELDGDQIFECDYAHAINDVRSLNCHARVSRSDGMNGNAI